MLNPSFPRLDILPRAQQALWPELRQILPAALKKRLATADQTMDQKSIPKIAVWDGL